MPQEGFDDIGKLYITFKIHCCEFNLNIDFNPTYRPGSSVGRAWDF